MTFLLSLPASLSFCCESLTSVQLTVNPVPRQAAEGGSVLLHVHNLPEDLQTFFWYKGVHSLKGFKIAEYSRATNSVIRGPAHSGRETGYTNGSLLLQDVTEKDAGVYTLQTIDSNFEIGRAHVQIHVNSK